MLKSCIQSVCLLSSLLHCARSPSYTWQHHDVFVHLYTLQYYSSKSCISSSYRQSTTRAQWSSDDSRHTLWIHDLSIDYCAHCFNPFWTCICIHHRNADSSNGHNNQCSNRVFKVYAYCHHCSTVHEVSNRLGSTMLCLSNTLKICALIVDCCRMS